MKNTLFSRHKKFLLTFNLIELFFYLLMIIGLLFLPLASYNPSYFDSTKITFKFFDLIKTNSGVLWGAFLVFISTILCASNITSFYNKENWKEKSNIALILSIASVLLSIIGISVLFVSCSEYTVQSSGYFTKETTYFLDAEIGLFLAFCGIISNIISLAIAICVKLVAIGKLDEDKVFGKSQQ